MHTNHRRKKPSRHKNERGVVTSKSYKRAHKLEKNKERRQQERLLIRHEEWDDLPTKYYFDLIWDYF